MMLSKVEMSHIPHFFYQVTTAALSVLQDRGYDMYIVKQKDAGNGILSKEYWLKDMSMHQPQFHY